MGSGASLAEQVAKAQEKELQAALADVTSDERKRVLAVLESIEAEDEAARVNTWWEAVGPKVRDGQTKALQNEKDSETKVPAFKSENAFELMKDIVLNKEGLPCVQLDAINGDRWGLLAGFCAACQIVGDFVQAENSSVLGDTFMLIKARKLSDLGKLDALEFLKVVDISFRRVADAVEVLPKEALNTSADEDKMSADAWWTLRCEIADMVRKWNEMKRVLAL
eukprot:TRINITY_DN102197_c0_g1_i1.p1 TRINITY_DN102197_c0_g1~~TRINITY_DN102197_c0_g1_i1.p1  ORF type:complete len:223 (+),score=59.62 TRINITY_DN102197_c0_g1_i1:84-752(+)